MVRVFPSFPVNPLPLSYSFSCRRVTTTSTEHCLESRVLCHGEKRQMLFPVGAPLDFSHSLLSVCLLGPRASPSSRPRSRPSRGVQSPWRTEVDFDPLGRMPVRLPAVSDAGPDCDPSLLRRRQTSVSDGQCEVRWKDETFSAGPLDG